MKKYFLYLAVSAFVMFALPWLAVSLIRGDGAMAVCLLLFFALYPLYSLFLGAAAGRDAKRLWSLPILSPLLFLAGTRTFFDRGEKAFLLYAAIYLALGLAAMAAAAALKKRG